MNWPTPQDYQEAIQNPHHNFLDEELRSGEIVLNTLGLPRVTSGSFASVYKFKCGAKPLAVRLFLRDIASQSEHYEQISKFVMSDDLPYTVSFEYIKKGILVHGSWFPVLKMEWVEGQCLDGFLNSNIKSPAKIKKLASNFKEMVANLESAGIAHGDLQHGNIMVINNDAELRLVDYDGMFVPSLTGRQANELGHRNYQHPRRSNTLFNAKLDRFSAWTIYSALRILERDPKLLSALSGLDECILFKQTDFVHPEASDTFRELENHKDTEIAELAKLVRTIIHTNPNDIPALSEEFKASADLPPLRTKSQSNLAPVSESEWWHGAQPDSEKDDTAPTAHSLRDPYIPARIATAKKPPSHSKDWPTTEEYKKAFQAWANGPPLTSAISHKVIRHLRFEPFNRDTVVEGTNSVVFKVYHNGFSKALKVFTDGNRSDLENRYAEVESFLNNLEIGFRTKHLLRVELFKDAIRVKGKSYPCVMTPWIQGDRFDKILTNPTANNFIHPAFLQVELSSMCKLLRQLKVTHGDIAPRNLIYSADDRHLKLLDYDTFRVPNYNVASSLPATEECQHPRSFLSGANLSDNFAFWVLDTNALASFERASIPRPPMKSGLWLDAQDMQAPDPRLQNIPQLKERLELMAAFCNMQPGMVPPLGADFEARTMLVLRDKAQWDAFGKVVRKVASRKNALLISSGAATTAIAFALQAPMFLFAAIVLFSFTLWDVIMTLPSTAASLRKVLAPIKLDSNSLILVACAAGMAAASVVFSSPGLLFPALAFVTIPFCFFALTTKGRDFGRALRKVVTSGPATAITLFGVILAIGVISHSMLKIIPMLILYLIFLFTLGIGKSKP